MTNKNLATVLQSLNQNGIPSFIPYLKPMLQRLNLLALHRLSHQLKVVVAIVEPKRSWWHELKDGLKGGIGLLP